MKKWFFLLLCPFLSWADVVEKVNDALNGIQTLQAQVCHLHNGKAAFKGILTLKRPGKVRLSYEKPAPYFFVSDGTTCVYMDAVTEKPLYVPPERLPLSFLLGPKTDLRKHFHIKNIQTINNQHVFDVETLDTKIRLQLIFSEKGVLDGWHMVDFEGNHVRVKLINKKINLSLKDDLFVFKQKPRWHTTKRGRR